MFKKWILFNDQNLQKMLKISRLFFKQKIQSFKIFFKFILFLPLVIMRNKCSKSPDTSFFAISNNV